MTKKRRNPEEAFQNPVRISDQGRTIFLETPASLGEPEAKPPAQKRPRIVGVKTGPDGKALLQRKKEKLVQKAYYITEKQYKALKLKSALSDKPEDKDLSSIVRAALDLYLADTLDTL